MSHAAQFLAEAKQVIDGLDVEAIERMATLLEQVRERGGRLFILGVGGSAANASHAVNDFRKIVGIEAYAPTDNVSELTARTNDEGWPTIFVEWLRVSRLKPEDLILVLSVGGGNLEKNVSPNLVTALQYAQEVGTPVIGIVGKDGGYTAKVAAACVIVPTVNPDHITPHSEAFQAVVWHLLVSHPRLKAKQTKWESVEMSRGLNRAVFLDRDGVLNRAVVRDGRPYPPAALEELEILPGVAEACAEAPRRRLPADRGDQPARRRPRHPAPRGGRGDERPAPGRDADRRDPRLLRGRRRLPAPQAESRAAARGGRSSCDRPAGQLHGRRPLARRRGRPPRRLPHRLHRPRLRRAATRPARRPRCRGPDRRRGLDPFRPGPREFSMTKLTDLKVKIFADGADRGGMLELYSNPLIKGFTTNPTLMRNAGITDYEAFARDIVTAIPDRPISLEVFSDDFDEMERQARRIASWGENVYVKIPVTNTHGESCDAR